ncbi:hypothetical protein AAFF_G00076910 [Aldrovandia affinis]|uniref:Uncharacterized protein n=1 Tax=Aldrovandia affinis TaxID=143900 RepID=A0AAD7RXU4_9TELE|nr:hypothetical protein AAFF_G00076910 [Aldrovandia affinis]
MGSQFLHQLQCARSEIVFVYSDIKFGHGGRSIGPPPTRVAYIVAGGVVLCEGRTCAPLFGDATVSVLYSSTLDLAQYNHTGRSGRKS